MEYSIPILWPEGISVEAWSPLAIMRAQAEPLQTMTKGNLKVEISTLTRKGSDEVLHTMYLVAVPLSGFRFTLLTVSHSKDRVYPATVAPVCFEGDEWSEFTLVESSGAYTAFHEEDFIRILREILSSRSVRSVISSLLAKINEDSESASPAPSSS